MTIKNKMKKIPIYSGQKTRREKIIYLFGLDLLRDWIFVNITMGMSVAIFAETNFSALLPIILKEMNLTTSQISIVMSLLGTMDRSN